jgi:hypothetical protein
MRVRPWFFYRLPPRPAPKVIGDAGVGGSPCRYGRLTKQEREFARDRTAISGSVRLA